MPPTATPRTRSALHGRRARARAQDPPLRRGAALDGRSLETEGEQITSKSYDSEVSTSGPPDAPSAPASETTPSTDPLRYMRDLTERGSSAPYSETRAAAWPSAMTIHRPDDAAIATSCDRPRCRDRETVNRGGPVMIRSNSGLADRDPSRSGPASPGDRPPTECPRNLRLGRRGARRRRLRVGELGPLRAAGPGLVGSLLVGCPLPKALLVARHPVVRHHLAVPRIADARTGERPLPAAIRLSRAAIPASISWHRPAASTYRPDRRRRAGEAYDRWPAARALSGGPGSTGSPGGNQHRSFSDYAA